MEDAALLAASLAVFISAGQAFLTWRSRNDYAKAVIAAARLETAADFLSAVDVFEDRVLSVVSAIDRGERSEVGADVARTAAAELDQVYDRVDALASKVSLLFDEPLASKARQIEIRFFQVRRTAEQATHGPNPMRHELKMNMVDELKAIKAAWTFAARAATEVERLTFKARR